MSGPSDTRQNEDMLFVSRDSLSERLLVSKARRYASTLKGVDAYQMVLLDDAALACLRSHEGASLLMGDIRRSGAIRKA